MKHSKRYAVIFNKWNLYKNVETITEFDTMNEVNDEVNLIEEMYADTPRPKHKFWNTSAWGEAFWGYLVVDFQNERIIKWGHDELRTYKKTTDPRKLKDWLFRGENEIPKDYKWKPYEYDGWLQYRWGNGLNAIKYGENAVIDGMKNAKECIKRCKYRKKKNYSYKPYDENEETKLDELNEEILKEIESKIE